MHDREKHLNRDDFTPATKAVLAERVGYRCSNPDCGAPTLGPSLEENGGSARIGIAAHIHAASPKGPRSKGDQTPAERSGESNGLWLCENCGKLVDSDVGGHSAIELKQWKIEAERRTKAELGLPSAREVFQLRSGDQTMYLNLPRFGEMMLAKGFSLNGLPPTNQPLLQSEGFLALVSFVLSSSKTSYPCS